MPFGQCASAVTLGGSAATPSWRIVTEKRIDCPGLYMVGSRVRVMTSAGASVTARASAATAATAIARAAASATETASAGASVTERL